MCLEPAGQAWRRRRSPRSRPPSTLDGMTTRRVIVDHVVFVVSDLEASRRFYTAALAPLGLEELRVQADGVDDGAERLYDFAIYVGEPATTVAHVAFDAPDRNLRGDWIRQRIG